MAQETAGELLREVWKSLHQGPATRTYDEALDEVIGRASEQRSLGKADIGALVTWKRVNSSSRWVNNLMLTPDHVVRSTTGRAWDLANDESREIPDAGGTAREALFDLPGMSANSQGAIASAVLLALSPSRLAV